MCAFASLGRAAQVTQQEVVAKVQEVLARTGDFRTPEQAAQRLGINLQQLSDMVNLKEIGNMAVDMCCSCGVYVLGEQPAVACEHCVVSACAQRLHAGLGVCVLMQLLARSACALRGECIRAACKCCRVCAIARAALAAACATSSMHVL